MPTGPVDFVMLHTLVECLPRRPSQHLSGVTCMMRWNKRILNRACLPQIVTSMSLSRLCRASVQVTLPHVAYTCCGPVLFIRLSTLSELHKWSVLAALCVLLWWNYVALDIAVPFQ